MAAFKNIFTWWEGATFGTWLFSRRNGGRIGSDSYGNSFFEAKKVDAMGRRRRWVMYDGSNDASRVAPEWFNWLHNTTDIVPTDMPPPRAWVKPAEPNLTGTRQAYRPAGALEAGGRRAAATGDYEAWDPGQA